MSKEEQEPQIQAAPIAIETVDETEKVKKKYRGTVPGFFGGMIGSLVIALILLSLHEAGHLSFLVKEDEAAQQEKIALIAAQQEATNKAQAALKGADEANNTATKALDLARELNDKNENLTIQLATLAQDLTQVDSQLLAVRNTQLLPLETQITILTQDLRTLEDTVQAQKKLLDSQNAATIAAMEGRDDGDLAAKLGMVDEQLNTLGQLTARLENELRMQRNMLKSQQDEIERATRNNTSTQGSLEQLRTNIQNLDEALAALPVVTQQAASNQNMARLIAANALKAAIERGGSYKNELQIFTSLAPDGIALDLLEKTAETGLPNAASLSADFTSIADKIAATENSLEPDANGNERIVHEMQGLHTRRPIGAVEGSNPAAIAARMEVAIAQGDYTQALQEWENLPDAAKIVSTDFVTQITVRHATDALLAQLIAHALGQEGLNE